MKRLSSENGVILLIFVVAGIFSYLYMPIVFYTIIDRQSVCIANILGLTFDRPAAFNTNLNCASLVRTCYQ